MDLFSVREIHLVCADQAEEGLVLHSRKTAHQAIFAISVIERLRPVCASQGLAQAVGS
jgi:hypothetical protein